MPFLHDTTTPSTSRTIDYSFVNLHQNNKVALQTNGPDNKAVEYHRTHNVNSIHRVERSYLYTFYDSNGSITLEAAITIPLFTFAILTIIYIMNIIHLQTTLQMALEETVRNINQIAYISSEFYSLTKEQQYEAINKDFTIAENIGASLISTNYIKNEFLDEKMTNFLNKSYIVNGSEGISFLHSSMNLKDNIIDVILTYNVSIPFMPDELFSFKLSNRCYTRIYMGKDMEKEQQSSSFYVYYTVYGKVLHTNKYCRYLLNYSEALPYNQLFIGRNPELCLLCSNGETSATLRQHNPVVYLTSDNQVFHLTLDCQSFTGEIFRLERTSLEENELCEECMKGK